MKQSIKYGAVVAAVVLFAAACTNPMVDVAGDDGDGSSGPAGSLSMSMLIPDYDAMHNGASSPVQTKIIPPTTRYIDLALDGEYVHTFTVSNLEEFTGDNGYFGLRWDGTVDVVAKAYGSVEIFMYDSGGLPVAYGSAPGVSVPANGYAEVTVTALPWDWTTLGVGDLAVTGWVPLGSMSYYDFYAETGTTYRITVVPYGQTLVDVYLFGPDGLVTGSTNGTDYFWADSENTYLERQFPTSGYYFIGVYGFGGDGDYAISVDVQPVAAPTAFNMEGVVSGWNTVDLSGAGDLWHLTSTNANSPSFAWYLGDESLSPPRYVDGMDNILVSPKISLEGLTSATLSFYEYYQMEPGYDFASVLVSTDGGASRFTVASPYTGISGGGDTPVWTNRVIDLSAFAGETINLVFQFTSDYSNTDEGWYIDDISISGS